MNILDLTSPLLDGNYRENFDRFYIPQRSRLKHFIVILKLTVSMSFLDIKNPARKNELVQEYVNAMQTVRKQNMHTREEKLVIGEELDTLLKPVAQATEKAASENKKEMEELRGALNPVVSRPSRRVSCI